MKLLLAKPWTADKDPTGWWMSEKLDGVRAYWDGRRFVSRLGNEFFAPDWFKSKLPVTPLDGELFVGRGQFQKTVSIVRQHDAGEAWRDVRYVVFDAPEDPGAFEDRLLFLESTPGLDVLPFVVCKGIDHLRRALEEVESQRGEGVMLRQPGSLYERKRSGTLLKVKSFLDADGVVVGHLPGEGKHKGRLGALEVEADDGVRFSVGTGFSDEQRESPPKIGARITYRFQELTNAGVPRFPVFVGERAD